MGVNKYIYIHIPGSSISTFFCSQQFLLGFTLILTFYAHLNQKMHICLDGQVLTLFSRVFTLISRENTLIIFGFKMHKVQKCQKWCNYAHLEKTAQKSINLSNEHLFVLFRGCRTNIIYTTYALFIDFIVHFLKLFIYNLFIHLFIFKKHMYLFVYAFICFFIHI